jgi:MFS family permease
MEAVAHPDPRRWKALAVLGIAYLMVILDVSIVNVALPAIQEDLDFAPENLQWVVSAYALTFGGFLLLGGRIGDVLGRRNVFMVGLISFAAFSLLCGFSTSSGMLIAARALQGAAGALLAPSVFSIVTVTFDEGAERNKALGILGAIAGSGAAIGVLLGGVFTEYIGWEWVFYINAPIAVAAFAVARRFVRESRLEGAERHFDALGAVTITAALMMLVYALTQANNAGWASAQTIGLLLAAGLIYFTQISVDGTYLTDLLPGFLLIGVGLGFSFVPVSIAALAGVEPKEAGLASGLINTSQQIGGALGVAILITVATTRAETLLEAGEDTAEAFTDGYSLAFWVGAAFALVSVAATFVFLRRSELQATPMGAPIG